MKERLYISVPNDIISEKVLVRVTNLQVTMMMKISVLKVRQLKRRSCQVAALATKAHFKKEADY